MEWMSFDLPLLLLVLVLLDASYLCLCVCVCVCVCNSASEGNGSMGNQEGNAASGGEIIHRMHACEYATCV